jgi:aconitate hydratase
MAPEYGATCGYFPVDAETLDYLRLSSRPEETIALVEAYAQVQGLWRHPGEMAPVFTDTVTLDLAIVVPSVAGPKRPQDRVPLPDVGRAFDAALAATGPTVRDVRVPVAGADYALGHGDVVIAAITSCTNTSNPAVMLAAGLVARKAVERGLSVKPWVKTSLAPGSKVVTDYLARTGLGTALDRLGFNLVGYGCTTCIGNSGPLAPPIVDAIHAGDLVVSAVLSGNRNFEGRVHQEVRANWLASPPLVVAFAIAGTTRIDLTRDALGTGSDGRAVYLRDLWPTGAEIAQAMAQVSADLFARRYADVFTGPPAWQTIEVAPSATYAWDESTYIKEPPFFGEAVAAQEPTVSGARILALLGDSVTTDHISPAGEIQPDSPAGRYLRELGVAVGDFNSYGARRGNHEVMVRGTFANIRIRNEMLAGIEGGFTRHVPSGATLSIYDAAMRYREAGIPLVVIAGKEYGTGSSRDWAAKGARLLGVKAVVAESFERIHRANLVGMGVLPVQFRPGDDRRSLGLTGDEVIDVAMPAGVTAVAPRQELRLRVHRADGSVSEIPVQSRLDTEIEIACFRTGGILSYVLQRLIAGSG